VSIASGANEGSGIAVYRRSQGTLRLTRELRIAAAALSIAAGDSCSRLSLWLTCLPSDTTMIVFGPLPR
jgi:hypothetical protein